MSSIELSLGTVPLPFSTIKFSMGQQLKTVGTTHKCRVLLPLLLLLAIAVDRMSSSSARARLKVFCLVLFGFIW